MKIAYMLINIDCLVYGAISFIFIRKADLKCISISIRKLIKIERKEGCIDKIIKVEINIDKHKQDVYFYII